MDELGTQQAEGPALTAGPSSMRERALEELRRRAAGGVQEPGAAAANRTGIEQLRARQAALDSAAERERRMQEDAANQPGFVRGTLAKLGSVLETIKETWTHTGPPAREREGFAPLPEQPPVAVPTAEQALPMMAPQPLPEALQPSLPAQIAVTPEEQAAQEAEANRVAQMVEAQSQLAAIEPRAIGRLQTAVGEGPVQFAPEPGMLAERNLLVEQAGFTPEQMRTIPGLPGVGLTEAPEPTVGLRESLGNLKRQFEEETAGMNADEISNHMVGALVKQAPPAVYQTFSNMMEGALRIGDIVGREPAEAVNLLIKGEGLPDDQKNVLADGFAELSRKGLELYPWLEPESAAEMAAAGVERMVSEMYVFMTAGRSFAARRGVDIAKLRGVRGAATAAKYYGPLDAAIGAANPENSSLGALEPLIGDIPGFDAQNPAHRAAFEVLTGGFADVTFGVIGDAFRLARNAHLTRMSNARFDTAVIVDSERTFLNDVSKALTDGGYDEQKIREVMLALPPAKQEPIRALLGPGVPARDLPEGLPRVETVTEPLPPRTIGDEPIPPRELLDESGQRVLDVREDLPTSAEVAVAGADRLAARRVQALDKLRGPEEGELPTAAQAGLRRADEALEEVGEDLAGERRAFEAQQDLERRTAGPTTLDSERIRLQRDLRGRAESLKELRTQHRRVMGASDDLLRELADSDESPMYVRIAATQRLEGREVFTPEYVAGQRAYDDFHRGAGLENRRRSLGGDVTDEGPLPPTPEAVRAAGDDLVSDTPDLESTRGANLAAEQGQAGIEATRVLDDTSDMYERLAQGNPALAPYARDPVRGLLFAAGGGAAMLAAESEGADGEKLAMLGIFGISGANARSIRRMAIKGLGVQAAAHIAEGVTQADWARQMLTRYGDDFTEEIGDAAWAQGHLTLGRLRERSSGLIDRMVDIDDTDAIRGMLETGLSRREVFVNRLTNRITPRGEGLFGPDAGARDIAKFVVKPRSWYKGSLRKLTKFFGNEKDADLFLRMYSTLSPQREAATSNITLAIQAFNRYKGAEAAGTLLRNGEVDSELFKGIGNAFQSRELADGIAGFPTLTVKRSDFTAGLRRGAGEPAPIRPVVGEGADAAGGRVVADIWLARLFGLADRAGPPVFAFRRAAKGKVVDDLVAAGWTASEARKYVFAKVDGDNATLPKKYRDSKATLPQRSAANKYIQQRKQSLTPEEYDFIGERTRVIAGSYGLDSYEAQSALWVAAKLLEEGADTDIRALHQILSGDPRFRSGMYDPKRGFLVEDLTEARDVARAVAGGETRAVGEGLQGVRNEGLLDSGDPAGAVALGARGTPIMHPALKVGDEIIEAPFVKGRRGMHIEAVDEAAVRGIGYDEVATGVDGFVGPTKAFFSRKEAMQALQKIGLASAVVYAMQSGTFGEGGEDNAENVMMAMGLAGLPGGARGRLSRIMVNALREFPGEGARIAGRTAIGAAAGAGISALVTPEEGKAGVLTGAAIGGALGGVTGAITRARLKPSRFGEGVKGVGARDLPATPREAFRQARAAVLDDIEGARKLVMEAETVRGGQKVSPEQDIEVALRASRAWAPYAEMIMRDGVMAPGESVPRTKRGLRTIYRDVGDRINDLRDYALARRARELDQRGKGIPEELKNYDEVIKEFEGDELIETAFTDLQENFQELLRVAEEVGLIEPGGAARIGAKNQNYVPFWRDIRTESAKLSGPFRQIIRQVRGSKFAVEDPIVTMVQAQAKFAEAIFRQRSADALWRFGAEYPDANLVTRVTDVSTARPSDMPRLTGGAQDDLFENLPRAMFDADGAEVHGKLLRVYDQGKAVTFKVNDDLLWDAYVQSPEAAAIGIRMGAMFSRVLREFVTTEPTFAATNFVRDVGTSVITSKTLGNPATRWPRAFKDALQGIGVALVAREPSIYNRAAEGALVGGALGYIGGTDDRFGAGAVGVTLGGGFAGVGARGLAKRAAKRAGAASPEDLYRSWVSSGGAQGVVEGFRTRREVMRGMVKDATRRQTVPVAHPIRVLQDLNRAVEEGNRLGEWIRLMERNGMDRTHPELMRDAMLTRDLTTDFLRKGGSKTIQAVSMLKAFWNPRVQGYDRLVRVFTESGRGTSTSAKQAAAAAAAVTIAAVTVPSLMLAYVNNKYHREEYLRDTTHFDRTYFWLVKNPLGPGFIRVPKPFEMGILFGSLPERLFENAVFGDDERLDPLTEGGLEEVLSAFGSDLTETISPVPTALDPWAENMTNADFAGQPVVNPYELLQNKARSLQDREKASEIGKWIADQLDVPAPQVDNVLTGYTGRVGEEALRIGDQILATMGESETGEPVAQRPSDSFLGDRFLSDTPRRTTATTTRFYQEFRDIEKERNTIADLEGNLAAQDWERSTEEGVRYTELKDAGKEIREMRNMQKQVRDAVTKGDVPWYPEDRSEEPLTGEEKRRIIDRLSRLVDEIAFVAVTGEQPEPLAPTEITF